MTMKAFSVLTVKSVDDEQRVITGIASTPTPDRVGDIVVPEGAKFKTPMPLLLYHQHNLPVGEVVFAKATKEGIPFRATVPNVIESGTIKDRVDEAWHSVKYGLIGAVSIGFRALTDGVELLKSGGLKFTAWEWLELSLVSVPAQPDAVIQSFKSMSSAQVNDLLGTDPTESAAEREALIKAIDPTHQPASGQTVVKDDNKPGASGETKTANRGPVYITHRKKK